MDLTLIVIFGDGREPVIMRDASKKRVEEVILAYLREDTSVSFHVINPYNYN